MNQNDQQFMRTRAPLPLLLSMSVPMMLSMLIQSLYNIVDGIFVARLGTQAITAVSLAYPLQNIVLSVSVGVGVGITSAIAISLGAGDGERASRVATMGVAVTILHCLLFVVGGLAVTRPFLALFTDDPVTLEWACQYSYVVLCASFGMLLQVTMEKIFQAQGRMTATMLLMGSGAVINIILDPILIFGYFGLPAMGVKGAAVATVIGQIAAFLLYLVVYLRRPNGIHISPRYLSFDRRILGQIYSVGIPSTLMLALPSALVGILNGLLAAFSQIYVAVLGLYFKLQTFLYMPASGVVQGMRPPVGYNYGAGEIGRVKSLVRLSLAIVAVLMAAGTVVTLLVPGAILSIFQADAQLMAEGIPALRIIALGFIPSALGLIAAGTFEALGQGSRSLAVSLLRQLAVTVPAAFLLSRLWGVAGVWAAFPVSEIIAAAVSLVMLRRAFGRMEAAFPKKKPSEEA